MIFVTVGTHEQQFNRLVEYMDKWANRHEERVVLQLGYSTYVPKYCEWSKFYSYQEMTEFVNEAKIVITHGGPSSFIMPLQIGKTPIVVPRQCKYDEHVNDHQLTFCRQITKRMGTIILVEDIQELDAAIESYEQNSKDVNNISNNESFCQEFERIVQKMFQS